MAELVVPPGARRAGLEGRLVFAPETEMTEDFMKAQMQAERTLNARSNVRDDDDDDDDDDDEGAALVAAESAAAAAAAPAPAPAAAAEEGGATEARQPIEEWPPPDGGR